MGIKSKLIEIFKRPTKENKELKIFENGQANDYPERIDRYINNSVTAKTSASTMVAYLVGQGWGQAANTIKVAKGVSLLSLTNKAGRSITRQRGLFLHINYDLNYDINHIDVLPFAHCRIGKEDDNSYSGKVLVSEDWSKSSDSDFKPLEFDVYNPKQTVIEYQLNRCAGDGLVEKLKNYKGQVLYVDLDGSEGVYPLSTIDAVQYDCDSEHQASVYKNKSLRKGFFGKTLVVTPPLVGALPEDADDRAIAENQKEVSERDNFRKTLKQFIGAENVEGILHLELEFDDAEGLEKAILFKNIDANINDKLFQFTETSVSNNIRYAFNNIPALLVRDNTGSLFGQSGEGIKAAKEFYQEQTTLERLAMVEVLKKILKKHTKLKDVPLNHVPLIEVVKPGAKEE